MDNSCLKKATTTTSNATLYSPTLLGSCVSLTCTLDNAALTAVRPLNHHQPTFSSHIHRGDSQRDPLPCFQRSLFAQSMGRVDHRRSLPNKNVHPPKSFMLRGWKEKKSTDFTEFTENSKWNCACHYVKVILTGDLAMQGPASITHRMRELSKDRLVLSAQGRMSLAQTRLENLDRSTLDSV